MGISTYYQQVINELKASAREASQSAEKTKFIMQKRFEEAQMSSSKSPKSINDHGCDKDCKYTKFRKRFSSAILSKLQEYGLDPGNFSPKEARKRLLALGMPIEFARIPLQQDGKDISSVESLLAKHGLSSQINAAVVVGIENRSMSSAIAFAEGLIDKQKPRTGFSQTV